MEKYEAAQDTSGRWCVTRVLPEDADTSVEILATCNTQDVASLLVDALKFREQLFDTFDVENSDGEE